MAVLAAGCILLPSQAGGQDIDDTDESGTALLRSDRVWKVVEAVGNERWEATWTLRSDGKTFDAHWVHLPGGDSGHLRAFARVTSLRGQNIVVERPGLGSYTGVISADRTRIRGRMSWSAGTWDVRLELGALPGGSPPPPASGRQSPATAGDSRSSPGKGSGGGPAHVSLAGQKWQVVESSGSERWTAEWTLRSDGRSFDGMWTHTPGGDKGSLTNFARIVSISGNQIKIERPGLGTYTGVISADRRRIQGKNSWSGATWIVSSTGAPLPETIR